MSQVKIVCVSGYFDPIHVGHIEYFKKSKQIGDKLMVIVNNDDQAVLKKGKPFMKCDERIKIISELKCVDYVVKSIDDDRTVCKTLETVNPKPFYWVLLYSLFFCSNEELPPLTFVINSSSSLL